MVKATAIKSLETGSGISWAEWLAFLELHKESNHTEMAALVYEEIIRVGKSKSPGWWAQGVTVAYEQYIGRRKPGQQTDGSFNVTVSKTVAGDMDAVLEWWRTKTHDMKRFNGVVANDYSITHTEKWRYWRCTLDDGSKITVTIQEKPGGEKSIISVNHDKLPGEGSVAQAQRYWKEFINA